MRACPAWLLLGLVACGEDGVAYQGVAGRPVAADFAGLIPQVPVRVAGGAPSLFLCDSGSPFTILDGGAFPELDAGRHRLDLAAFELGFPDWPSVSWNLFGADDGLGGILGGDLLGHFAFTMDYAGARVWLSDPFDPAARPADVAVGDEVRLPFEVRGGGQASIPGCTGGGCTVRAPATRLLLRASFESRAEPVWAVVDSGASAVVIDEALLAELGDAGRRPRLDGVRIGVVDGEADAVFTRVWRVTLGGAAAVDDLPVLLIPGSTILSGISAEVGVPVRALVGGSLLRHFLTTLDYQTRALRLMRYHDPPVPADEFVGPALSFARFGEDWILHEVYPGHDAHAEGLRPGDVIEEIDGMPIRGQPGEVLDGALARFALGDQVPLRFRRGTLTGTVDVLVEDVLPSYPPP